ncbi:MAG TPA: PilW family protein [Hydrogenophaga sp.]|uniref:PilW family protein n=1 Tax=Hydrogenophaga sp. TaxID=1904254 RepID=UPI002B647845|nr:PilW family protein [Hydrogenophaga sp.]HMN93008.1 PilW family protein [Hydrogenophaga sp.]HMP10772.1 PilW family protein [Hydrogenophaga sp.]
MKHRAAEPIRVRRQVGLTLVELMIGVALSLLVILAVTYVFSASRASYRHQESFSAVQESGRIALEVLARDIRMAGNPGCGNLLGMDSDGGHLSANAPNVANRFSNAAALTFDPLAPNRLTLVRGSAESTLLEANPAANQIRVDDLSALGNVQAGATLLLSDCAFTEVIVVQAVAGNVVTAAASLARQFRPGSQVMRREQVVFELNGNNELTRNNQPIVGGVAALAFQYGVAAPGNRSVVRYVAAPTAAQQALVQAVRVNLQMTDRDVVNIPFGSTITLRNRAP